MNNKERLYLVKLADAGQPLDEEPGPIQGSYVAEAPMHDAYSRMLKVMEKYPDGDMYDNYLRFMNLKLGKPLSEMVRRSNAVQAESQGMRLGSDLLGEYGAPIDIAAAMHSDKETEKSHAIAKKRFERFYKKFMERYDPDAEVSKNQTPWHLINQHQLASLDMDKARNRQMREESPWHYWLNPMAGAGPLSEFATDWATRDVAGEAKSEDALGRFLTAIVPLAGTIRGDEEAQQALRNAAMKNKLYPDEAKPEKKKKDE